MLTHPDRVEEYLTARWYLYALFQNLLGNEPSVEQFQAIDTDVVVNAWQIMFSDEEADLPACFLSLVKDADISALKTQYTRFFIGPNKLDAPPWESIYTSNAPMLFTKETLDVRNLYRSQGFITAEYPRVADDHIAIELDFMSKLAERAINEDDATETLKASLMFLEDHLLKWVPKYVDHLNEQDALFYPKIASVLFLFIQKDAEKLSAILTP